MTIESSEFHIHGDNIVECERTVQLIRKAFRNQSSSFFGPFGSPVCPTYTMTLREPAVQLSFTLFPGFGRWHEDILELIRNRGGALREAADVVITAVRCHGETPLAAIEYCGALPAGNQAWQRNGRAYSFGKANVPYLYIAELGGYELDKQRLRKAPRLPNPAVPFSYLAYSLTNGTPTLPVFLPSPGAGTHSRQTYSEVFADEELLAWMRSTLLGLNVDAATEALRRKSLSFVAVRAGGARKGRTLAPAQWEDAYEALHHGRSLVDFLVDGEPLKWMKIAYIASITPSARLLMEEAAKVAVGLTSSELPMCVIPKSKRAQFAATVEALYAERLQPEFRNWLTRDAHLSICWVMGFKPRHDDARPDRGLPPLARMLIGDDNDLLTVVYGPAPPSAWHSLHSEPHKLTRSNGLWEAIFSVSDAILADSATDPVKCHGYLGSHWKQEAIHAPPRTVLIPPTPRRLGENDVDTATHLIFAHYLGKQVFEGLCNPPGGDWSGISLQTLDRQAELRWLTLPRVSHIGAKRPDHVFQIFSEGRKPTLLSIESKENAANVEADIGPRLVQYVEHLLQTPASIVRSSSLASWSHTTLALCADEFCMASAVAFLDDSTERIDMVKARANVDLLLGFQFADDGAHCVVKLFPATVLGQEIADIVCQADLVGRGMSLLPPTETTSNSGTTTLELFPSLRQERA